MTIGDKWVRTFVLWKQVGLAFVSSVAVFAALFHNPATAQQEIEGIPAKTIETNELATQDSDFFLPCYEQLRLLYAPTEWDEGSIKRTYSSLFGYIMRVGIHQKTQGVDVRSIFVCWRKSGNALGSATYALEPSL